MTTILLYRHDHPEVPAMVDPLPAIPAFINPAADATACRTGRDQHGHR
jgi:hypothetical protein